MFNLMTTTAVTESVAMDVIFDACRANELRQTRTVDGYQVTFTGMIAGEYLARVYKDGVLVANAIVDGSDV